MRDRIGDLRREVTALAIAARDPRTPWYARAIIALTVGLAVSPIDPIPDFIPVLGYADDLVFVPVGAYLARRAVPADVMESARERADERSECGRTAGLVVGLLVVVLWLVVAYVVWIALAKPEPF